MATGYKECIVCNCNVLIPWSDLFRDEFEIPHGSDICSEECYIDGKASEAEYRYDWLTDR